jgi:hypothetical protein
MNCEHCSKEYTNKSGYSNHVRRCPKNPKRILETLTPDGREKIRQSTIAQNKQQWNDPTIVKKHKESMRRAVQNNPESYSSSNRGRTKQIIVDGIKLQGRWEVDFYQWAKEQNLTPKRPDTSFKYIWDGERWYHPDFYIPALDLFVEVKGYETDRDRAKWSQFTKKLCIVKETAIHEIRKNEFTVDKLIGLMYN